MSTTIDKHELCLKIINYEMYANSPKDWDKVERLISDYSTLEMEKERLPVSQMSSMTIRYALRNKDEYPKEFIEELEKELMLRKLGV